MGISPALHPLCPIPRYRKAFDVEPSLHSGINAAVLLIAAGQRFEDSDELRLIGEPQFCTLVCPTGAQVREREHCAGARTEFIPFGSSLPGSTPGSSDLSWALVSP